MDYDRLAAIAQRPFIPPLNMCVACHGEDGEHREDCIYDTSWRCPTCGRRQPELTIECHCGVV